MSSKRVCILSKRKASKTLFCRIVSRDLVDRASRERISPKASELALLTLIPLRSVLILRLSESSSCSWHRPARTTESSLAIISCLSSY